MWQSSPLVDQGGWGAFFQSCSLETPLWATETPVWAIHWHQKYLSQRCESSCGQFTVPVKGPQVVSWPTSCSKKGSCEMRPGCSGLYLGPRKPPRRAACFTASLFSCRKTFSLYPNQYFSCFDLHPWLLIFHWRAWLHLPSVPKWSVLKLSKDKNAAALIEFSYSNWKQVIKIFKHISCV